MSGPGTNDQPDPVVEKLWEWASRQNQHILDEFSTAVVGIGALFFAYGQLQTINVKLMVALIGLVASLILWNDMTKSKYEYDAIMRILGARNPAFLQDLRSAWRESGFLNRWSHQSPTRTMYYFMLLVAWAWAVIIIFRLSFELVHTKGILNDALYNDTFILNYVTTSLILLSGVILTAFMIKLVIGKRKDKILMNPM